MKTFLVFLIVVGVGSVNFVAPAEMAQQNSSSYQCYICGKKLSNSGNLTVHMRSHDPTQWRYKCRYCSKKFNRRQNKNNHQRTHTGERPFKCGECGKDFLQKSNLNSHKRRVHEGVKFPCPNCNKRYTGKSKLLKHIERIHTVMEPSTETTTVSSCPGNDPVSDDIDLVAAHVAALTLPSDSTLSSIDFNFADLDAILASFPQLDPELLTDTAAP